MEYSVELKRLIDLEMEGSVVGLTPRPSPLILSA
jgi:hypothetical protein